MLVGPLAKRGHADWLSRVRNEGRAKTVWEPRGRGSWVTCTGAELTVHMNEECRINWGGGQ